MRKTYFLVLPFLLFSIFTLNSYSQETQTIEVILDSYEFVPDTIVVEVNKPV